MAKSLLSRHDLERAVLAEIRSCYGCEDVTAVDLNEIADPRFNTNWGILTLLRPDEVEFDVNVAEHNGRAIATVQGRLRPLYDLKVN
jgi:hypothetical protein